MANEPHEILADLQNWLYVSEAVMPKENAAAEVAEIVQVSRRRNASLGVTGGLLYTGKRFSQLIEGSGDAVAELRRTIEADSRHRKVTTLCYGGSTKQLFRGWSLVYSGASRYMANLLDNVVLGLRAQQMAVQDSIVFLFQQFAAQEVDERSVWHGNFSP
jgi:hypothetical protein